MFEDGQQDICEDSTNYKAISCEQIPELFLDKIVAKKHFSKFGKIKRFILRPKRLSCTVEYENKEDAERAYKESGNFNGVEFVINYAKNEIAHVQNTEEWVDPDVQAELDAMSAGHRLGVGFRPTNEVSALQKSVSRAPKCASFFTDSYKQAKIIATGTVDSVQLDTLKVDTALRSELENILKRPAFTDEEKYRVLDARDKLIRLTTIRQTDIKKAVATKGTCPDMCPEKERLMREFQRQVSIFEMAEQSEYTESTISHRKAVKEYSRSSADQEVPLSHELRSESVLEMTMLYLMHRIMYLCDDPKTSLGDWFHFVWDRTRSIRKDITQQELCSLGAVRLVEQCARFHIHCAARLVAEDSAVFDKKINAENLTKCLQTLKYMYHDLRIKGIHCPCEAEFRSYVILLNLGDSNFLWEVKQLPETIQKSLEIKRAITFYNALQNNNFVKFFAMIKSTETSYLSACILLGYFTKLRVRAMEAIIKSHNWRKNDVYLPLSYLVRILGFDDESSAVNFFTYYGLQCDTLENRVLLDRLSKPDIEYAMDRALQLVESKRQISVGECIFGQKLPPAILFENHEPHNSFDDKGVLKLESWCANDQLRGEATKINLKNETNLEDAHKTYEKSIFKIPQFSAYVSPKQQKQHSFEQGEHISNLPHNTLFDLTTGQEENARSSSPGGFKFGDNIFGLSESSTKCTSDNIFKSSTNKFTQEKNQNYSPYSVFKTYTKDCDTKVDNIFIGIGTNAQSKASNIFSAAAKETANFFQQFNNVPPNSINCKDVNNFQNDTTLSITNPSILPASQTKIEKNILKNEMVETKLELKEHEIEYEKLEEEKRKFKELEEKKRKTDLERIFEKQNMEDLKNILKEKSEDETEKLILRFVSEEVFRVAQAEVHRYQTIIEYSCLHEQVLIAEVVQTCVEDIAHEEYAFICYDQLLLNRYFNRWLLHVRKKKEQRKLMENTPLWVTTNSRTQYTLALEHPSQNKNLEMIKRYRLGQPCDFNEIIKIERNILYEENQNPLNLFALVGQHLLTKLQFSSCGLMQQRRYFKFIIALPADNEESLGFESLFNKWLIKYIERAQMDTGPFILGLEHNLALCVRKLSGITPKNEEGNKMSTEGDHNDGVVFFISGIDIKKHSRKRLYNLLKLTRNQKRIPLAIIAYNCKHSKKELIEMLDLDMLQEDGLIDSYVLLGCGINKNLYSFRNMFIDAVNFITDKSYLLNSYEFQALAMQNVLSFLETALGEEMWQRWCDSARRNPVFNKICSFPEHVIGIYNKGLDHLLHITQEDFTEMPEFPKELKEFVPLNICSNIPLGLEFFPADWKDKTRTDVIKNLLENVFLPEIEVKVPNDIEELKQWLLNYATQCIKDDDLVITKSVYEAITNLINQLNYPYSENIALNSRLNTINYLNIFKPIVFAHINYTLKNYQKELTNLYIIYLKDDFKNYQTQPWWLNYQPLNLITLDNSKNPINLPHQNQQFNVENPHSLNYVDAIIEKAESTSKKAEEKLLKFKHKKSFKDQNNFDISGTSLQLKRALDDSFYHFQLSKNIGEYDNSFTIHLTQDIDKSIDEILNQTSPTSHKKRRLTLKSTNQYSDMDEIITKARNLIEKIDTIEDRRLKTKKLKQLY